MKRFVNSWKSALVVCGMILAQRAEAQISVDSPKSGALVCSMTEISGTIRGDAKVAAKDILWIVVHPKLVGDCWVQDPVSVASDGTWSAYLYFGEPVSAHDGLLFEFKVLALSTKPSVGKTVCWPDATWISPLVTVTRRQSTQCR